MKTDKERGLVLAGYWASCAMAFGLGYLMLTTLAHGEAVLIASIIVPLGALCKVFTMSRLRRL